MKYIIRLLAILPACSVGGTATFLLILALDYSWLVIPSILNYMAFTMLLYNYENSVKSLTDFIKLISK